MLLRTIAVRQFSRQHRLPRTPLSGILCVPQISKRHQTSSTLQTDQDTSNSNRDRQDEKKGQPQGSYVRSFALLGVGFPLGWLIGDQINGKSKTSNTAKPGDFVKYALVDRQSVSSTSSIFTLRPSSGTIVNINDPELRRAVTSVQFKQPQLQIARSYTVLPAVEGQDAQELRFLIRKEQKGEVSGYLHRLAMGAEIEVRGPSVEYVLPEKVQTIAFLAGGTGIVPALQIADMVTGEANVHLLWANRKREDCVGGVSDTTTQGNAPGWSLFSFWGGASPASQDTAGQTTLRTEQSVIVTQLQAMKTRTSADFKLNIDYFVDEEGTFIRPTNILNLLQPVPRDHDVEQSGQRLLFVSGPEGFVNYWAGPKQWVSGREVQGPLGGALSTLDLQGWTVVKL